MVNLTDKTVRNSPTLQEYGNKRELANSEDAYLADAFADLEDDNQTGVTDSQVETDQRQNRNDEANFMKHIAEIPPAIGQGLMKSVQETGNLAIDMADWVDDKIGSGELIDPDDRISFADNPRNVYQPETSTGKVVSGISNFLFPFGAASKVAKGIKVTGKIARIAKAGTIGAAVDFAAFDPHEQRLSNLMQKNPELANPISQFLAADKDDTAAEGRFKNALEGIVLGIGSDVLIEGLTKGIKAVRGNRIAKNTIDDSDKLMKKAEEAEIDITGDDAPAELEKLQKEIKAEEIGIDPDLEAKFEDAFDATKPDEDFAGNINLNKIRSSEDVKKIISTTAEAFKGEIDEARRGVIKDQEVRALATDLGLSSEDLLSRGVGEAFNAEQLIAARRLLNTSADTVFDLSEKAFKEGADEVDSATFLVAWQRHKEIQSQVSGAVAEAGRALRSQQFEVGKLGSKQKARYLEDMMKSLGGEAGVKEIAGRIKELKELGGTKALADVARRSNGRFIKDAVFETWINSLLSGPKTHLTNILSNSTVLAGSVVETGFARASSIAFGAKDSVQEGEVYAQISGLFAGFTDGMRLAGKTIREGVPASAATKLDEAPLPTLSADSLTSQFPKLDNLLREQDGSLNTLGKGVDLLANVNRLPSRFLLAEDEFFKAVNMRMRVHQMATRNGRIRQAAEGLSDTETKKVIADLIDNPGADITADSVEFAKVNTFTNDLVPGSFSSKLSDIIKTEVGDTGIAPLRVVMPFVRTPINLLEFALDRTPLKFNKLRTDLRAGGARRDMAVGRMGLGMGFLGTLGFFGANGLVTGGGPANNKANKFMRSSGWQAYSIKIGDTYVAYDKLDPFGQVLGMAADMGTIFNEGLNDNRQDSLDLLATGVGIVAENMTPEFMTENLERFLEMFSPGRDRERAVKDFAANTASGLLPLSGFFRNMAQLADPTRRETRPDPNVEFPVFEEIKNKVMGNIPGLSSTLPPKRNMFGDEIEIPGPINPISITKKKNDPVIDRMVELGMNSVLRNKEPLPGETHLVVDMPQKFVKKRFAGKDVTIRLDADQYDRFVMLSAGKDLKSVNQTLKQALASEMKTKQLTNALGGTEESERLAFKKIISQYRKLARQQLLSEDKTIFDEMMEESANRRDAFNPTNFR